MKTAGIAAMFLIGTTAWAQPVPQTVLFVCEHGAAKSVVAAAHFNKLAAERGLPFRAISRGTAPDPTVPPRIVDGLKGERLTMPTGFAPALVTSREVSSASRVVTFDVTLPVSTVASRVTSWNNLPAFSDGYGPASAAIAEKVKNLLQELEAAAKKKPNS
jgi:arsenate reductase